MPDTKKKMLVFLSHASEDKLKVRSLCEWLRQDGFDPWLDEERLLPGQDWNLEIEKVLRVSDAILLCFSTLSVQKEGYIQREYKRAMKYQEEKPEGAIFVIPVRLDECEMPFSIQELQSVDYPDQYDRLVMALKHRMGRISSSKIPRLDKATQFDNRPKQSPVGNNNMVMVNSNIVIQVQDIYGSIFDTPDFRNLVSRVVNMDRLRALRNRMFIAQETAHQERADFDVLIDEFKRNNEFPRLLSEVKENDPEAFRRFLKGHALGAIGISSQDMPDTSSLSTISDHELNLIRQLDEAVPPGTDIEVPFVNKDNLFAQIHKHPSNYIVVYGPGGVGKTYFLQNFPKKFDDTRCVYIDLEKFKVAKILPEIVRQLNGEQKANPASGHLEVAKAINTIHRGDAHITRFFFLFDSAHKNQDALDYIFQADTLIDNKEFQAFLKARKSFDRIDIKIVLAARKQIKPREPDSPFHQSVQIKYEPLSRDSVQVMLEDLANKNELQVFPDDARTLSNMVFYLTGGHPGCVRPMLLVLNEQGFVTPGPEKWIDMYRQYVLPVIQDEMLSGLRMETQMHIFSLCIFRRVDQRLLGGLIDRAILSCPPGESSRLARELRPQLEQTQLFEQDHSTDTMIMNYALRHALTLNMQYESFERYKALQALALEIFLDRLQNTEITSGKAAARTVMHLFEMVYHWARYLEMDIATTDDRSLVEKENSKRLQRAFVDYLSLSFAPFQKTDLADDFLRLLAEWWDRDHELRETIQRATGNGECGKALTRLLVQFVEKNGQLALQNGG